MSRRFKVQFSAANGQSGDVLCHSCTELLESHLSIQYRDESRTNVGPGEYSQLQNSQTFSQSQVQPMLEEPETAVSTHSDTISVGSVAEATLQKKPLPMSRAYANTDYPTDQLATFIRLCLTDPNFPAFVEAVEKELQHIATNEK